MSLDAIEFKVETKELDDAITKIGTLQRAVKDLGSAQGGQTARQQAKEQNQITLDAIKNETALVKARAANKKALEEQEAPQEKLTQSTKKSISVLERQIQIYENMVREGLSKGQASTLAMAQAQDISTESARKLIDVMKDVRKFTGGDTFDKSVAGLTAMQNRYDLLVIAATNYATKSTLTIRQAQDLALDTERLTAKNKDLGLSVEANNKSIVEMTAKFKDLANKENELSRANDAVAANIKKNSEIMAEAERKRVEAHLNSGQVLFNNNQLKLKQERQTHEAIMSEMTSFYKQQEALDKKNQKLTGVSDKPDTTGNAAVALFVKDQERKAKAVQDSVTAQNKALGRADEMLAKLDNRISQMSHKDAISPTAANSLFMYEKALKQAGVAADVAATKVEAFRKKQQQVSDLNLVDQQKKIEHLSRALAPQVTDITVGLMTGQNPFTVFLQQGGQVRDLIGQSRVETEKLGEVFKKTFQGMIDMVAGMGRALLAFLFTPIGMILVGLAAVVAATVGALKMLSAFEDQNKQIVKSLTLFGNSAGLTADNVRGITDEMDKVKGISTSKAVEAVVALASTGALSAEEFKRAGEAAVRFEKYAGVSISETAKVYKELNGDPLKAVIKLNESTGMFTATQIEAIATLERMGETEEAATLSKKVYTEYQESSNERIVNSLYGFELITSKVSGWFAEMYKAMNNQFKPVALDIKIDKANIDLTRLRARESTRERLGLAPDRELAQKEKELFDMLGEQDKAMLEAAADAYRTTTGKAEAELQKWTTKFATTKEKKAQERRLVLAEAAKLGEDENTPRVASILKNIETGKSGPKKETSDSFSINLSNELQQYEKQYAIEIKLQDDFIRQEKARLDNSLSAKEITQGEFNARDIAASEKGYSERKKVTDSYYKGILELNEKNISEMSQQYLQWVNESTGNPDFVQKNADAVEVLRGKIINANNETSVFLEKIQAAETSGKESAFTRFSNQLSILKGEIVGINKAYSEYLQSEAELTKQKQLQTQLEDKLRFASPEAAVYIKAQADETQRLTAQVQLYDKQIRSAEESLGGMADVALDQFLITGEITAQTQVLYNKELERYNLLVKTKNLIQGTSEAKAQEAAQTATIKYQKDQLKALSDGIAGAVETGLFEGGDAGKKSLRKLIEAELRKPITVFIQAVVGGLTGLVTSGASAAGLAGGATSGGIGGWLNAGSTIKSAWDAMTGGFSAGYASFAHSAAGQYLGLSTQVAGPATASGVAPTAMTGAGTTAGTALGYAGAGLAGIGVGSAIAGDKSFAGLSGQDASAIGAIIGGIAGGPLGAFLGGVAGGMFNAAFGEGAQEFEATRLVGGFTGAGFSGTQRTRWSKEGGWFSSGSSGEDVRGLGTAQQQALNLVTQGTKSVFDNLIKSAGESEKSIASWTFAIDRQVNSEEQQKQLIIDMASSMGNFMIPSLKDFIKTGENLADTAVRMNDEFLLTNKLVELLGQNTQSAFGAIGLASLGARDNLVELMGGISAMTTTTQGYYENFFSETERHDNDLKVLTKTFKDIGVVIPETREGFRALVESQDLSTLAGRTLVAQLLGLQGAFAAVTDSTEDQTAAYESMLASGKSIYEWLQKLKTSALGLASPQEAQASTRGSYLSDLSLARVGNTDALGNITGSAESYLQASMDASSSFNQYRAILAQVQSEVGGVPAVVSYQQELLNSANASLALAQQQNALLFSIAQSTALMSGTTAPSLLTTAANGSLSVGSTLPMTSSTATSTTTGTSDVALVAIRDELVGLRYEVRAGVEAEVKATKILTRVSRDGENFQVLTGAVYNLP